MRRRRHGERGVALLLVLWVFMVLGVLALDFARYMRDDAMATVNLADATHGYYLALAGMNRAIYDAERRREENPAGKAPKLDVGLDVDDDEPLCDTDGEPCEGEFAGGRWRVVMTDEASRLSLNRIEPAVLKHVITNLMQGGSQVKGIDRRTEKDVDTVVDSILDWRDRDSLALANGAESDYYLKRRPPYRAKNAFFDSPEELLLVRGVTPALFYGGEGVPGLRDIFSVYSRSSKLHMKVPNEAVMRALIGIDAANEVFEQNAKSENEDVSLVDQLKVHLIAVPGLADMLDSDTPARVVRIEASGDVSQQRNQAHVTVIADLQSEATEGTRIIRWLDQALWEGPAPIVGRGGEDDA